MATSIIQNYDGIVKYLADTIYKQIKRKPAVQENMDQFPDLADVSFTIKNENTTEIEIMEKVAEKLENKRISTSAQWDPIKPGFSGHIVTTKENVDNNTIFHFKFYLENTELIIV